MNKYLILVKHSLPQIVENIPAREWKLSQQGQRRAAVLAEKLRTFQPNVIASSKEPKAQETAEIIAGVLQLPLHIAENLHEHDRSNVSYLSNDELQASVHEFFENPDRLVFGGETANQTYVRFERAVYAVVNSHANKTLVIVAHGTVISLFVCRLTGVSEVLLWNELGLPSFLVLDLQSNQLITIENIL